MKQILLRAAILIGGCAAATAIAVSIFDGTASADDGLGGNLLSTATDIPPAPDVDRFDVDPQPQRTADAARETVTTSGSATRATALPDTHTITRDVTDTVTDVVRPIPPLIATPPIIAVPTLPTGPDVDPPAAADPMTAVTATAAVPAGQTRAILNASGHHHDHTRPARYCPHAAGTTDHTLTAGPDPTTHAGSSATSGASRTSTPQSVDAIPAASWHPTPPRAGPGQWPDHKPAGRNLLPRAPSG